MSSTATARFANDPHQSAKAFLHDHRPLFGHGPEALDHANVRREFVTPHSGMTTIVWEQEVDGIPVYEGVLVAHITRAGELVNISSQFLPDPVAAANRGTPDRAALQVAPTISAVTRPLFMTPRVAVEVSLFPSDARETVRASMRVRPRGARK